MKNNKKIIALLLVLILIIYGCSKLVGDSSNKQLSKTELDKLSASLDEDIKVGEFESLDTDNDGLYDKFVLTLDRKEIAEDLFLDKSMEYKKTEEGSMGTLILQFENTGNETKTYSHRENIPKSFAAHVDDLIFSIPPTKIIDPDPDISWELDMMSRTMKKITIEAKNAAMSAAMKADPERTIRMFTRTKEGLSEEMIEAGIKAAGGAVLDNLGSLVFISALNDCNKFGGEGTLWNTCIVKLMIKSPNMFTESDCEKIDIDQPDAMNYVRGPILYRMCKAIMTKNWEECHEDTETWREVDMCKLTLFKSFSGDCEYIKDKKKKDECIYDAAERSNSMYGCKSIAESVVKYECLAELTQEIKYCKEISDKNTREYCCDKISDEGARRECYGGKEEKKEKVSCWDKSEGLSRDSCWRLEAKNNCNTSICINNFKRDYDINECIHNVAVECGINYCLNMRDSHTFYNEVSCIYTLAKDKKDCRLIGNREYESVIGADGPKNKETCLERFEEK